MNVSTPPPHTKARFDKTQFLQAVSNLLGPKGFTGDAAEVDPWLTDWRGRYHGAALGLASPATSAEVADLVRLCAQHRVPIVPQGGNSGMVGGATPDASGTAMLLSLRRMTALEVTPGLRRASCGAGVILQNLHDAAAEHGLRFPLSLGGKGSATLGGLVSTNAGGTQVLRHGVMRSLVEGLEVVLPDGQILDATGGLVKDNRGFDLKQIFIGSEGTLGIVTRVVVKLVPAIATRQVIWCGVASPRQARELLLHCQAELGPALEGFELIPRICLENVVEHLPGARPPLAGRHEWHVLLEFVAERSGAEAFAGSVERCLAGAMESGLVENAVIAANETQAEAFWQLREMIAPAERAKGEAVQHDISVAPERMPDIIETLSDQVNASFPGHETRAFGHLGDGNIHFHVVAPPDATTQWQRTVAKDISTLVYDHVSEAGGSISAEHGIGQDKLAMLERTHDPVALDVMRKVKAALDPGELLNPGKLVTLAPSGRTP